MSSYGRKYQKKICIIVDNPLRDLNGLTKLASVLAQESNQVFLVPMYFQGHDVPSIAPDIVITNFLRPPNVDHVKKYRIQGSLVGVLDTEGICKDIESYWHVTNSSGILSTIDFYLTWGLIQKNKIVNEGALSKNRVFATGCPRYDFLFLFRKRAQTNSNKIDNYILINTNFPLLNPAYSKSMDEEIKNGRQVGYREDLQKIQIMHVEKAAHGFIKMTKQLARTLKNETFVVRPHPFEDETFYSELSKLKNVKIIKSGTSIEWVSSCKALIHLNCSTSVEASFYKKPIYSPGWLDTSELREAALKNLSTICENVDEMALWLKQQKPGISSRQKTNLNDWFHDFDGRSSDRVKEAINKLIALGRNTISSGQTSKSYKFKYFLASIIGFKCSNYIRTIFLKNASGHKKKEIDLAKVNEILHLISESTDARQQLHAQKYVGKSFLEKWKISGKTIEIKLR